MKVNLGTIELTHEDLVYIGRGKKAKRAEAKEWCLDYILKKINKRRRGGLFDDPLFEIEEGELPPTTKKGGLRRTSRRAYSGLDRRRKR